MNKFYQKLFKNTLSTILTVAVASLAVVGFVYAATTIGDNVSVGGTFTAVGNATTSANLVIGTTAWAAPTSTLSVIGNAHFFNKVTTSDAMWVGTGGTANNLDLGGGDLFVQNDVQVGGKTFMQQASSTSATTTDYLYVGSDGTEPAGWNFKGGDVFVGGDSYFGGKATTSGNMNLGSQTLTANATTTLIFGGSASPDKTGVCLKFHTNGYTVWCQLKSNIGAAETSTPFWCSTTSCE